MLPVSEAAKGEGKRLWRSRLPVHTGDEAAVGVKGIGRAGASGKDKGRRGGVTPFARDMLLRGELRFGVYGLMLTCS